MSVFFAASVAAVTAAPQHWFDAGGAAGKRVVRYLLGLAGTAVLLFGLTQMEGSPVASLGLALLAGGWILLLAPWLFVRLGLARAPAGVSPAPPADVAAR
ncbi:MAG: hypothetical protein D6768_18455 [Chloroflexi bacterium]|nr:MAG: hypothetical protein D6768_18455 [Chloroflexota bacterium]